MALFVDAFVNTFHKGFLTTPQGKTEDPTYLGFKFQFDFDPVHRSFETGLTESPLFAKPGQGIESAEEYLTNIGYKQRAAMVAEFKEILRFVNEKTPWYFQTVEGLQDLWKINKNEFEFNSYRGQDKVLTISCLESIDMRITAMADLYRKMTFDSYHLRELLPENLRWFNMVVNVAEMRSFHKILDVAAQQVNTAQNNENANTGTFNATTGEYQNSFEEVNNLISMISFRLEHCEFDFEDSFPSDQPLSVGSDLAMATQRMKIKVGRIREVNQYKLFDLILQDDKGQPENSQVGKANTGSNTSTRSDDEFLKKIPDLDNAFNSKSTFNPLTSRANELQSELQRKLERAGADVISRGTNAVNSKVTGIVLGNVYDLRNQSLATIVGGFVGANQQAQVQALTKENVFDPKPTTPTPPTTLGNAEV